MSIPFFNQGVNMSALARQKPANIRKMTAEEMRKKRDADHQTVKGVFRCYEPRGGSFTFSFKKYKGDQTETYIMVDGDTYVIPLMVAKHLNQNCWYPRHAYIMDMNGHPIISEGKKVQRCSFESLEFSFEE